MSRLNSFYLAPALWQEPFRLHGEEAHHLLRVLRARPGDTIRLFDGLGRWGFFRVSHAGKKDATMDLLSVHKADVPAYPLTLALGWSKGTRRGFVLEKAVELGATAIWFWTARRSQGDIPDTAKESWTHQLVAAAKQCGTAWLPQIRTFTGPAEMIQTAEVCGSRILCWEEAPQRAMLGPDDLVRENGAIVIIGPEGGLDGQEAAFFQERGFSPASLGRRVLRFETAALYVLAMYAWAASRTADDQDRP
ncbi:MAG: 16S rRNA (uracil(1498)-N(3))-methyltransferase [Desulfovibrionales bacterium]|nr:16S rRNA (uracil(1498)-N(3))-methyltransferase [Desulfovibrionales bacterium]